VAFIQEIRDIAVAINKDLKMEVAVAGPDPNLSDAGKVRIPTTSFILNLLLGGGVPLGRVMEVYGDESVGKSTVAQHMMVGFQQSGGISVLLDAETGWDRERALAMGHDNDRHLHLQADTVELGAKALLRTVDRLTMPGKFPKGMPIGIFWDTISSSQTEGEKEGDLYKDGIADKARKIRQMLRTVSPLLPKANASLVFVSQTITTINKGKGRGGGDGSRKIAASGGNALRFWASKRLKIWRNKRWDYPESHSGILVTVLSKKDKMQAPNYTVDLPLMYDSGIHPGYELVVYLLDNSRYVNMDAGQVVVPDYPEPGEQVQFWMKQLPKVMDKYPDLLEYLSNCAEASWPPTQDD
jgi:recombination protein RecA